MSQAEDLKIHEAHERAEIAHADKTLSPVSLTMAILAVFVAAISMLGHRAHNEVLLAQTRANFQKADLVGKETQQHADEVLMELLVLLSSQNPAQATALEERSSRESERLGKDMDQARVAERRLESESNRFRKKANRLNIAELFCELALVLCSISLLTRQRSFWFTGLAAGALGLVLLVTAFWVA